MTQAAWWFRHQTQGLLRRLYDPRWALVLAVSPDVAGMNSRIWPVHLQRIPQGRGNLGDRMARLLSMPASGSVAIIGGDIPGIQRQHIARAFAALGAQDAVFGPSPDGGYWLVGLKNARKAPVTLFENVRWSSPHALSDSVASLKDLRTAFVDVLQDVDTIEDLRMTARHTRAT